MLDNIDDLETPLKDINKFSLNGYQIKEKIASGSFWNVWLAEKNGNLIIAKQYNTRNNNNYVENDKSNIIQDIIKHYQELTGTNIFLEFHGISFYDFNKNRIFDPIIIQKYATNNSLKNLLLLLENKPKSINDTKKMIIIYGLAKIMKTLHEKKINHFNLKPSKILLDENYYPFLCDVGSKRMLINENNFDEAYLYAAPETIGDYSYFHEKSDVFSFGMIMLHILSGKKPYSNVQNLNLHKIKYYSKLIEEDIKKLEDIPSFFKFILLLTLNYEYQNRPNFAVILDFFDRGIILPSILKKPKEYKMFLNYIHTLQNVVFFINPIDMLKRYLKLDNISDTYKTVIHFFLADYWNDVESQKQIGLYYYNGNILTKSGTKALIYFLKAKKQNDAESIFYEGQIYFSGFDCQTNKNYAWRCFKKSSLLGCEKATRFIEKIISYLNIDQLNPPKAILVGDANTGKTTFINKLINQYYVKEEVSTIGVTEYTVLHIDNIQNNVFTIRDTMGMERFASVLPKYCRDISICIIMYDVTDKESFNHVDDYFQILRKYCDNPFFILI